MIHYTCDLCGCSLGKERFEAKIEVAPVFNEEELAEEDFDKDHLQQIAHEISEMETTGEFELEETGAKNLKLDFCSQCAKRFMKSPLSPAPHSRVTFSNN
ncbi:hypothetical protein N8553_01730 [bacterium]|jgi:hypothetical protein|nr:hypothetical protein [Planctomicrobium sp.]MDA7503684.1 hypothetical protein [bacterium]